MHRWTRRQLTMLRELYEAIGLHDTADALELPDDVVQAKAIELGLAEAPPAAIQEDVADADADDLQVDDAGRGDAIDEDLADWTPPPAGPPGPDEVDWELCDGTESADRR